MHLPDRALLKEGTTDDSIRAARRTSSLLCAVGIVIQTPLPVSKMLTC